MVRRTRTVWSFGLPLLVFLLALLVGICFHSGLGGRRRVVCEQFLPFHGARRGHGQ
jgi:hypothetical protein